MNEIHPSWRDRDLPMILKCQVCGAQIHITNLFSEEAQLFDNWHLDCLELT